MKIFFYSFSILTSLSLMTQAMQEEQNRPELEALQKIAMTAFPSPVYRYDHGDDQEILEKALNTAQNVAIFTVPNDVFLSYIIPYMTSPSVTSYRALLALGCTCYSFYQFSRVSSLYLSDDCLTEGMPHAIPINILRSRTWNTKDGLFKLARLFSVSAEDLCGWFDPAFLQSAFLSCQHSLPRQLEGQSEEVLGALYPSLKVALAAIQVGDTDEEQKTHVMKLVREYANPLTEGMSLNKLRLLSLNPDRPGAYGETLQALLYSQNSYPRYSDDASIVQIRGVIARELLIKGRKIGDINDEFFVYHPQKKDLAIQIIGLCIQHPNLCPSNGSSVLIGQAFELGRSDLALDILSQVIKLPDDADTIRDKIWSLVWCESMKLEDENIQLYLKKFSSDLYDVHWGTLNRHEKNAALSLLMYAGRRQEVQKLIDDILLQSEEEFLRVPSGALINDLVNYNYPEEAKKLILFTLNVEQDRFISIFPYIVDYFFDHAITVDREKTIALLRGYVESHVVDINAKLEALKRLAKFAIGDEKGYIISKISSLSDEKIDDFNGDLANIYYYLGNRELCHFYYQKMIQKLPKNKDQEALHSFQKAGLNIVRLEDLATMDPFEFFDIFLKKDNR